MVYQSLGLSNPVAVELNAPAVIFRDCSSSPFQASHALKHDDHTSRAGEVAALLQPTRCANDSKVADRVAPTPSFFEYMVKAKAKTEEHACASEDGGR